MPCGAVLGLRFFALLCFSFCLPLPLLSWMLPMAVKPSLGYIWLVGAPNVSCLRWWQIEQVNAIKAVLPHWQIHSFTAYQCNFIAYLVGNSSEGKREWENPIETFCISVPGRQQTLLQIKLLANLLWCCCWCVWPDSIAIRHLTIPLPGWLRQQLFLPTKNNNNNCWHYVGSFLMKIKCCSGRPKAVHVLVSNFQQHLADGNAQRQ